MTDPDLARQACPDCLPTVKLYQGRGVGGQVWVVVATHALTCPWLTQVAPDGEPVAVAEPPLGVVVHGRADS